MSNTKRRYGWIPDVPDQRDWYVNAGPFQLYARPRIPPSVDMRKDMPPIIDQEDLGSCTACAIVAALQYCAIKQGHPHADQPYSRLFVYYNERVVEGNIDYDTGAMIRTGVKCVNDQGACFEELWPYIVSRFANRPQPMCYKQAQDHQALEYARVPQSHALLRATLASGYPIIAGLSLYESFESDEVTKSGVVPLPGSSEVLVGGHAILVVGYNEGGQYIVRNSWGTGWGQQGYFELPCAYLEDSRLADDLWVIRQVE